MVNISGFIELFVIGFCKACGKINFFIGVALLAHFSTSLKVRVSAQQNISTTTCHIRCNRNHSQTTCFSYYFGFFFMLLGIEHIVRNAFFSQKVTDKLRLFNGYGTHKNGLSGSMYFCNLFCNSLEFAVFFLVNNILHIITNNIFISRDNHYIHVVNFTKFIFLCFGSTGHSRKFIIHSEKILQSNSSQGFRF